MVHQGDDACGSIKVADGLNPQWASVVPFNVQDSIQNVRHIGFTISNSDPKYDVLGLS